jgi:oligosaccharide repeat unit polymerase
MRPFYLYLAAWILPLTSAFWFISDYNIGVSTFSLNYLVGLLLAFFVTSLLFSFMFPNKAPKAFIVGKFNSNKSIKLQGKLIIIWYSIFLLEVLESGGVPAYGLMGKIYYYEFGIPSLHGFSNMLRALIWSNLVLLYLLGMRVPVWMKVTTVLMVASALLLEQSRGTFAMTLLFALGPMAIFMKISIFRAIRDGVYLLLFLMVFSAFRFIRYSESPIEEMLLIANLAIEGEFYKYLIEPAANYIAAPILNAGLNLDVADAFRFSPYETIQPLIPSRIRHFFPWNETDYGELLNEMFNTTTYVTPFVRDFGLIGGFIAINSFFVYCTYVFFKARNGSVEHIIKLSPLMMCLALSFFTSYLTSLVTLVYILISRAVARRMV